MKYLNQIISTAVLAGGILLSMIANSNAQTNDPKLSQQYYIFDHNIDHAWNVNKGSSNTRIAIHSLTGFTSSHEDLSGARYLNPWTQWFGPQHGFGSEIAGIVGAQTNNSIGMAGINWNGTMKSYNILREKQSGDNDPAATFTYNSQDYYLDIGKLDAMVDQAIQDNMDIHVFNFGVSSAKVADLKDLSGTNLSLYSKMTFTPSEPDPQEQFWSFALDMAQRLGNELLDIITGNNYTPPSDLELFRQKLWEATQPANNGVNVAPVGDAENQQVLNILMPAAFDNYVVTVAGAEKDASGQYIQWQNSLSGNYIDVSAAAKNILSVSGDGYSAYNNDFNSTAASAVSPPEW